MSNYTSADVPESSRVVIDPVTRIEGHLRVEMEAGDGVIKNAWTSTTQYRGIEVIACKRDPRDVWAFVERICGVCTGTHAIAALAAVEDEVARAALAMVIGDDAHQPILAVGGLIGTLTIDQARRLVRIANSARLTFSDDGSPRLIVAA